MELDRVTIIGGDGPGQPLPLAVGSDSTVHAVVWPGVGAHLRTFHRFELAGEGRSVVQCHEGEAVYYVVTGTGTVCDDGEVRQRLEPGAMIHIDAGTAYHFEAGPAGCQIVGGPCPADLSVYESLD